MVGTNRSSSTFRRALGVIAALAVTSSVVVAGTVLQASPAGAVPAGFQDQVLWSGFSVPTEVAFANDGKVFVCEKSGMIYRFDGVDDTTRDVVADLRTEIHNWSDRGLLGLAVDPNFGPSRPFLYVQYTYDHILGSAAAAPRWGLPGRRQREADHRLRPAQPVPILAPRRDQRDMDGRRRLEHLGGDQRRARRDDDDRSADLRLALL